MRWMMVVAALALAGCGGEDGESCWESPQYDGIAIDACLPPPQEPKEDEHGTKRGNSFCVDGPLVHGPGADRMREEFNALPTVKCEPYGEGWTFSSWRFDLDDGSLGYTFMPNCGCDTWAP